MKGFGGQEISAKRNEVKKAIEKLEDTINGRNVTVNKMRLIPRDISRIPYVDGCYSEESVIECHMTCDEGDKKVKSTEDYLVRELVTKGFLKSDW